MKAPLAIAAIVVVLVAVGAASYYLTLPPVGSGTTSTPSTTAGVTTDTGVHITSDNLTVSPSGGSWQIAIGNTGALSVSSMTVYLQTPLRTMLCSGAQTSNGLFYKNCPAMIGNPLPPGSTISGGSTSAEPASATPGTQYTVGAHIAFTDGQTIWVNSTVIAKSG